MITIKSDYSKVYSELDRLEAMPTPKMVGYLDTTLEFGFEAVRADIDVDTGRLKASAKKKSSQTTHTWRGAIEVGNPAAGVDYGVYERARGGSHDFFAKTGVISKMIAAAIAKGLRP